MDSLHRDVLGLILDAYQRMTLRAFALRSVSRRWAALLANRTRYPPLLHHQVILVPAVPNHEELERALPGLEPVDAAPDPAFAFVGRMRHNGVSLLFVRPHNHHSVGRHLVASPLVDAVLIPLSVARAEYRALLAPNSALRSLFPMPMRVRLIVAATGMEDVAWEEQPFVTMASYFASITRLAPTFVPISCAAGGAGITHRAPHAPWYHGPALLEALAQPMLAPSLPPSDTPLLLVLGQSSAVDGGGAEAWVRVFRRRLRPGCVVYRKDDPITITKVHTPSGCACEGSVARVCYAGSDLAVGQVLEEAAKASPASYRTQLRCTLTLRDLPPHCPLMTPGFECNVLAHLAVAEAQVTRLLAVLGTDGKRLRPTFAKSKQRVHCVVAVGGGDLWTLESGEEGVRASGFEVIMLTVHGIVVAHGRVVKALAEPTPTPPP